MVADTDKALSVCVVQQVDGTFHSQLTKVEIYATNSMSAHSSELWQQLICDRDLDRVSVWCISSIQCCTVLVAGTDCAHVCVCVLVLAVTCLCVCSCTSWHWLCTCLCVCSCTSWHWLCTCLCVCSCTSCVTDCAHVCVCVLVLAVHMSVCVFLY